MVVNSEQILFHQKGRVEAEEESLSQARAFICPEGITLRVEMLFGVGVT